MLSNRGEPALAPLLMRAPGGLVAFERQPHEQLGATQFGPSPSSRVQGNGKIVRLGNEVASPPSRHRRKCSTIYLSATPVWIH